MQKTEQSLLEKKIWKALQEIPDPELNISIVDLGLIYSVKVKNEKVNIKMTLTSIGCPLFGLMEKPIETKVKKIKGVKEVKIKLVFEPPWTMDMMTEEAKVKMGLI